MSQEATYTAPEPWVTKTEVADHLNCSTRHVERLTRSGAIPSRMIGGLRRYRLSEVDNWAAAQEV